MSLSLFVMRSPLVITFVAIGSPLVAAIPGVPAPPRPGPFPDLALTWANDAFGGEIGDNADDYRTNQITAQGLIDRRWLLVIDHSILTNKATDLGEAGRSDELTVTAGALFEPFVAPDRNNRTWIAGGIGGRFAGDLGGQEVQNLVHDAFGYNRVELPYGDDEFAGVAYATAGWLWLDRFPLPMPTMTFLERGQIGLQLVGTGLATTEDEQQAELGIALTVVGIDGAAWIGPRYRWNLGSPATPAAEAVALREDELWLDYGASAGGWVIIGGVNLDDRTSYGAVGWIHRRRAGRIAGPRPSQLEADLSFSGGFAPGVQFRWQPPWLRALGWVGERAAFLFDYRYGQVDGIDWGGDSVLSFNQATLGMEVAWERPRRGWRVVPFVRAAIGGRYEVVRERGPDPRYEEQSAASAVVMGGGGVRLTWGPDLGRTRTARYGIAVFADGWLPFDSDEVVSEDGSQRDEYLVAGFAPGAALTTLVAW